METSDLKSTTTLLTRCYTIQNQCDLSNEILCILMTQGAAKLCKAKVEYPKKDEKYDQRHNEHRN